jgi:hypothetical protein
MASRELPDTSCSSPKPFSSSPCVGNVPQVIRTACQVVGNGEEVIRSARHIRVSGQEVAVNVNAAAGIDGDVFRDGGGLAGHGRVGWGSRLEHLRHLYSPVLRQVGEVRIERKTICPLGQPSLSHPAQWTYDVSCQVADASALVACCLPASSVPTRRPTPTSLPCRLRSGSVNHASNWCTAVHAHILDMSVRLAGKAMLPTSPISTPCRTLRGCPHYRVQTRP